MIGRWCLLIKTCLCGGSWRRWMVKSPQYVSVHLGTNFATIGPLNLRADMDAQHMAELVPPHTRPHRHSRHSTEECD